MFASSNRILAWPISLALLLLAAASLAQTKSRTFPGANWQDRTPEQAGMDRTKLDALRDNLRGNEPDRSAGCVVRDGYLIYSWGAFNKRHNWASAAKPGLSTMLFVAIAEGKVSGPDSPLYPHWPNMRTIDRTMTFRHVADMMSGYACADKDKADQPLPPGSRWAYNDYAIMLYARTLDKVFGGDGGMASGVLTGLVAAAHARFTVPLQFEDTELFEKNKGRVVASPRDFARLGWLWLNQGNWNGKQVLPRALFEQHVKADVPLGTPKTETTLKPPFDDYLGVKSYGGGVDQGDGQGIYGFNWWYNKCLAVPPRTPPLLAWSAAPADVYMALGRAGKDGMVIFPSSGLVVAAYNDASPTWGDAIVSEPPDPKDVMNQNLKLLVEAVAESAHRH
jgi:CubicO group peptidase (beta-lactamase class C family)